MNNNSQSAQDIIQKLKLAAKNRRKVEADKEKSYLSSFDAAKNIHNIDAPNERYMESIVRNSQSRAKSRPRPNIAGDEKLNTAQTRLPKRRFRGKSINKINFVKKIDFVKQNIEEAKYPSNSRINTQSMNYQPTITHQSRNKNLMMGNTSFNNTSFVHNNLYNYDLPSDARGENESMFLALSPSIEPNIQTAGQNTVRRININPNLLNSNDQQGSVIRKSLIKSPYEQTQRMIQSTARQRPAIKLETEIDNLQSIASRNTQSRPRQVSKVNLISMHKAYAGDSIRSGNFAKKKLSRFNVNTAKYGIQNLVNNSIFGHNNEIKPFFTKEIIIRN